MKRLHRAPLRVRQAHFTRAPTSPRGRAHDRVDVLEAVLKLPPERPRLTRGHALPTRALLLRLRLLHLPDQCLSAQAPLIDHHAAPRRIVRPAV